MKTLKILLICLFFASCGQEEDRITRVIDGDTVEACIGGKLERLRLLGVNTPEMGQLGAFAIKLYVKKWLQTHDEHIEYRLGRDGFPIRGKYGRLLVWIIDDKGEILNMELIKMGYSKFETYGHKDLKYQPIRVKLLHESRND